MKKLTHPILFFEKNESTKQGFKMKHMSSNVELLEVSWRTVFNTNHKETFWNGHEEAYQTAKKYGYKFYTWNGWIYSVEHGQTNIKTDQLDGK